MNAYKFIENGRGVIAVSPAKTSGHQKRRRLLRFYWLVLLVGLGGVESQAANVVGRTAGSFGVSSTGAATYRIPIQVAAGQNGMKPDIALTYRSGSDDGLAGLGWTISGLSRIARCGLTPVLDGDYQGVRFTHNDRYCLDGKPLIQVGTGDYWGAGQEYRTEIHDYEKVISIGSVGSGDGIGPRYFEVQHRNGLTYRYGFNEDSRVEAVGNPGGAIRVWALDEIRDTYGTRVFFSYEENSTTGAFRPATIKWSAHAGETENDVRYKLTFLYENRPAAASRSGYTWGTAWKRDKRLRYIDYEFRTSTNFSRVHRYALTYAATASDSGRSVLSSVQQCGPEDCLAPTTFESNTNVKGWEADTSPAISANGYKIGDALTGDFNGDGRQDIFVPSADWKIIPGTWNMVTGSGLGDTVSTGLSATNPETTRVIDYNGDGLSDLLTSGVSGANWHVYLSNGTTMTVVDTQVPKTEFTVPTVLDFNGDGLGDILYKSDTKKIFVRINNGNGFNAAMEVRSNFEGMGPTLSYPGSVPDFDGDGRDDYFEHKICIGEGCFAGYYIRIYTAGAKSLNYRDEFLMGTAGSGPDRVDNVHVPSIRAVDLNGDGLSDLMYLAHTTGSGWTWYTAISRGKSFNDPVNTMIQYPDQPWLVSIVNEMPYTVADYDMDGRDDLIVGKTGAEGGWIVYPSDGSTFQSSGISLAGLEPPGDAALFAIDIGGTGYPSLVYEDQQSRWVNPGHTGGNEAPRGPHEMNRVTDGLGNYFAIHSQPVPQIAVYSGSAATPDEREIRDGSFYVVNGYEANDGTGSGSYSISYLYADPKRDMRGRGFLGFGSVKSSDSRDDTYTISTYRQDFPYIGRLDRVVRYQSDGKKISDFDPDWEDYRLSGNHNDYYFIHLKQSPGIGSVLSDFEVDPAGGRNGQLSRTTTRRIQYDFNHGSISQDVTTVSSPAHATVFTSTVNLTFRNFGGSVYCLGFPGQVETIRSDSIGLAQSRSVQYGYNPQCQRVSETSGPTGDSSRQLVTKYEIDQYGKIMSVTSGSGDESSAVRKTTIGWDQIGGYRQISETANIDGETDLTTRHAWDYGMGLEVSRTDPRGLITSWHYDDFGRLKLETRPGPATTSLTIEDCTACFPSAAQYKVRAQRTDGFWSENYYDSYGRVVGQASVVLSGSGTSEARKVFDYDPLGRVAWESRPSLTGYFPFGTWYRYDLRGRIKSRISSYWEPNYSALTTWAYDRLNVTVNLPDAGPTTYYHDAAERLIETRAPLGSGTINTYWPFGQLKSVSQGGKIIESFTYDSRGYPKTVYDVDRGTRRFSYNVFGEMLSLSDDASPTPNSISMTYDQLGRLRQRVEAEGLTTWEYHQAGHGLGLLDEVTGPIPSAGYTSGSCSEAIGYCEKYVYDSLARLVQAERKFHGEKYVTNYRYNSDSRITAITYPAMLYQNRYTFIYAYAYGHLDTIAKDLGDGKTQTIYDVVNQDAFGHEELSRLFGLFGNGVTEYDHQRLYYGTNGRIRAIKTGASPLGTNAQNYEYSWYRSGNLKTRSDLNQADLTEAFQYDALSRLDKVYINLNEMLDIDYSPNGNIRSRSDVGIYHYSDSTGSRAVTSITDGPRSDNYHYDVNGNMDCRGDITSNCVDGDRIAWTSFGKPRRIDYGNDFSVFDYGPDRRRIWQRSVTDGISRNTRYIGAQFELFTEGNRTNWKANVFANGRVVYRLIEHRTSGACSSQQGSQGYFVLRDHQNSVDVLLNDGTGNDTKFSFDAFGKRRNVSSWTADDGDDLLKFNRTNRRGYTGHEHLDNVRLIHMNGRVQDPILGRMISSDSLLGDIRNPQSFNTYSYALNNPLSLVDPKGFSSLPACAAGAECLGLDGKPVNATLPDDTVLGIAYNSDKRPVAIIADPEYWKDKGGVPELVSGSKVSNLLVLSSLGVSGKFDMGDIGSGIRSALKQDELVVTAKRPKGVFVTGHRVLGIGPVHTAIQVNDEYGRSVTLSAGPVDGFLVSDLNRPTDDPGKNFIIDQVSLPQGSSVRDYMRSLIRTDRAYCDCVDYDLFPGVSDGYNSNSYVQGLLNSTDGTTSVDLSLYYGGREALPNEYFNSEP